MQTGLGQDNPARRGARTHHLHHIAAALLRELAKINEEGNKESPMNPVSQAFHLTVQLFGLGAFPLAVAGAVSAQAEGVPNTRPQNATPALAGNVIAVNASWMGRALRWCYQPTPTQRIVPIGVDGSANVAIEPAAKATLRSRYRQTRT